jgi:CubicO group peptidase (beta-lactamase class C family)
LRPIQVCCLLCAFTACAAASPPDPAGQPDATVAAHARERLDEVLKLLADPDPSATTGYFSQSLAKSDAAMSIDEAISTLAEMRYHTRGIETPSVRSSDAEATATGRARLTGEWTGVRVRIEPDPPYRVVHFGPARAEAPETNSGSRPTDAELAAQVEAYARRLAEADVFSGVVLLAHEDRPLLLRAFGQAEKGFGIANRPDTRFNIGSITKTFTAVSVLQLVERGVLSLDDPLSRFLPDVPDVESARKITIRQLLTHTSGLGDHVNAMARDPFRTRYRTVGRMLDLVRRTPPLFEPGTQWRYSNSGFLVLGNVVEKASGQDYYEYVRHNVFEPAGMSRTGFFELDGVNADLAVGYQVEFGRGKPRWRSNQFDLFVRGGPEGGAYSTAEDLFHFARALRGHRLLGPRLTAEALEAKPDLHSPGYGYGFEVEEGGRVLGHGGSFVGAQGKLDMFPEGDYTAVVLSNYGGAARPVVAKVRRLILAGAAEATVSADAVK